MIAAPKIAALGISESIAAPEIIDPDFHYHKCPICNHIWGHVRLIHALSEEYAEAHKCPNCKTGRDNWKRHFNGSFVCSEPRGRLIVVILEPFL